MPKINNLARSAAIYIACISLLIGLVALYNIVYPIAWISRLEQGYWGGYYEYDRGPLPPEARRIWCLCKFFKYEDTLTMVMLSPGKIADTFSVRRRSGESFVDLEFTTELFEDDLSFLQLYFGSMEGIIQINARQLLIGKRYPIPRLLAGRYNDFWEKNDEDDILGNLEMVSGTDRFIADFAIERLDEDNILQFCNDSVLEETGFGSVEELDEFLIAEKMP